MKHAIVCDYAREVQFILYDYVEHNKDSIYNVRLTNGHCIGLIELKSGDEVWILPRKYYYEWCKGRTYMIDGELYHSDLPCKA